MAIFKVPGLANRDYRALELLRQLYRLLRSTTRNNPHLWHGVLRKNTMARAIHGSVAIEGYRASMDEVMAAIEGEPPPSGNPTATWSAINGCHAAMNYIIQSADDPYFEFSKQHLKSLHFMMTASDLAANPGQWRPGAVSIVNQDTGDVVYKAPSQDIVDPLVGELVKYLDGHKHVSSVIAAAMAHLNLTLIHPFKDGNGRMSRALQTLVPALDGFVHLLMSGIEEWLGKNTRDYYATLADVGQGSWQPENDALPWIRVSIKAHYQQANTLFRRMKDLENVLVGIIHIFEREGLNDRTSIPLVNASLGFRLTNPSYQEGAGVSPYVAGRDLRALADLDILIPHGEKQGRYHTAGRVLTLLQQNARKATATVLLDPYDLMEADTDD